MITLALDDAAFQNLQNLLANSPRVFKKAAESAARKSTAPLKRAVVDEVTRKYFITPAKFKREMSVKYSNAAIILKVSGPLHTLSSFFLKPKKRPKKRMHGLHGAVKRTGGIKFFPTGFLLYDNTPFMRTGKGKKDIEPIYGPAYSQIAKQTDNIMPAMTLTKEKFLKNLNHEVLFRLGAFKK